MEAPSPVRREMIDLYLRKCRAIEELDQVKKDICNVYSRYINMHGSLIAAVEATNCTGRKALLLQKGMELERFCESFRVQFIDYISTLPVVTVYFIEQPSTSVSSDIETDDSLSESIDSQCSE